MSDNTSSSESIWGGDAAETGVPGVGVRGGLSFLAFVGSTRFSSEAFLFFTWDGVVMGEWAAASQDETTVCTCGLVMKVSERVDVTQIVMVWDCG